MNMDSRTPFVKEVAKTIIERHGKENESFIFGISGKWGEGKTFFLNDLRKTLRDKDASFEIFDINPWKFSMDRISFLRNFLRTLYAKCDPSHENELRQLDVDTSTNDIHWGRFAVYVAVFTGICLVFTYTPLFNFVTSLSPQWKFLLLIVIMPIVLAAVQSATVVQRTDHAIVTLDKFDDLLQDILNKLRTQKKKIVIFVDDLDRVTPSMARDVLDNLRTFFDKKEITFVVTGDHTVLEGYLGRDLLPDEKPAAQLEEGRRFLKKIFNVYWRLPLPIKKEVQNFVEEEFEKRSGNLNAVFPKEEEKAQFAAYLEKYFDSNYRQIIRFLDTALFNFQIIKQKAEDGDPQQSAYFKEMLSKPLLVVRILMMQELCAPLFDQMVTDAEILRGLEYAVEKRDAPKVAEILDQSKDDLSPRQRNFMEKFVYEEPRFYRDSSLQVLGLQPYLSLAADASFGDQRGPSSEDFMATVNSKDSKRVRNDLLSMGDAKAQEGAKALSTNLPPMPDAAKIAALKTLLSALVGLPPESSIHKIFAQSLSPLDYTFLNNTATPQKMEVLNIFWRWLDMVGDAAVLKPFESKFSIKDIAEFNAIDIEGSGSFRSYIVTRWVKDYYPQQKNDALSAMVSRFPKLNKEKVREQMDSMSGSLINDLLQDSATQPRENRLVVLKDYTANGATDLKKTILDRVSNLDSGITGWAISKTQEENPLWTMADIENQLLTKIDESPDFNSLIATLRFTISNHIGKPEAIWPKISPKHNAAIVDNLPQVIDDASLQPVAPPEAFASQLMDDVIKKLDTLGESEQAQWLNYVVKGKWPWVNLQKYPIATKLKKFKKVKNDDIKKNLSAAEESWADGSAADETAK